MIEQLILEGPITSGDIDSIDARGLVITVQRFILSPSANSSVIHVCAHIPAILKSVTLLLCVGAANFLVALSFLPFFD